jgi:hypothetical protein
MSPDEFDRLLDHYATQSRPRIPADLRERVWQEVECRRHQPFFLRTLSGWSDFLREPRLAVPAFVLAIAIGTLPIFMPRSQAQPVLARAALGLEVFSAQFAGMPSTLLAVHVVDHVNPSP